MKVVLSIAGSDSSGGAGIQADLKTMTAHGVYGATAITALTAQNTMGVYEIVESSPKFLEAQIEACLSDIPADAVKIGMVPSAEQVERIAKKLKEYQVKNIVVDPVMVATSGSKLTRQSTQKVLADYLFPLSRVITPNIPEAEVISNTKIFNKRDMERAARIISEEYECSVLVKGGHTIEDASDVLCENGKITWFDGVRVESDNTHGTGCTLSSAIASNLALEYTLEESIRRAKNYITACISDGLNLGKGQGPLNHMKGGIQNGSDKWEGISNIGEVSSRNSVGARV